MDRKRLERDSGRAGDRHWRTRMRRRSRNQWPVNRVRGSSGPTSVRRTPTMPATAQAVWIYPLLGWISRWKKSASEAQAYRLVNIPVICLKNRQQQLSCCYCFDDGRDS